MRPPEEHAALQEMKALRANDAVEAQKRVARAVADVVEGVLTIYAACRSRRVDRDALRAELRRLGWTPTRVRTNNTHSRRKQ